MKEINEKDLEKASGGGEMFSIEDKRARAYIAKGYTLIADDEQGMTCEDFFDYSLKKGWCGVCQWHVYALDTHEHYCTKGH